MTEGQEIRIGDAERQAVIDVLRRATGEGRLTLDEFAERVGQVYAARLQHELDQLIRDLPHGVWPATEATSPSAAGRAAAAGAGGRGVAEGGVTPASAGAQRTRRRRFVAVMSATAPRGRWRPSDRMSAFAWWGEVRLDMRDAIIDTPVVDITAWAIMGSVTVIVPEGIPVELNGCVIMGGSQDRTRSSGLIEGAPLVRVRARGLWGGVAVRNPRRRRSRHDRQDGKDHGSERARDRDAADVEADARADEGWPDDADRDPSGRLAGPPWFPFPPRPPRPRRPPFPGRDSEPPSPPDVPLPGGLPGPTVHDRIPPLADRSPVPVAPNGQVDDREDDRPAVSITAPDERLHPVGGTLTLMVTDIASSTEMADRLGDQRWLGVLQAHNALVREQLHRYHGTEVKAQGDGFLATFTSARQAVLAAIAIQRAMARYREAHREHQLRLRVGLHTGEVAFEHGDVLGQNVVVAVRIAAVAAPDQILVSALTKDLTDAGGDLGFDPGREAELKGITRPWRVHAVTWQ